MGLQPNCNAAKYLVRHDGKVQGPFDGDFIETVILVGVHPTSVSVSRVGTTSWGAYQGGGNKGANAILQAAPTHGAPLPTPLRV